MTQKIINKVFISIFILLALTIAEVKEEKGDEFLIKYSNIQNQDLRKELEALRKEFNFEKNQIQDYYNEKIEFLKKEKKIKMKKIKAEFGEKRDYLLAKYPDKKHINTPLKKTSESRATNPSKLESKEKTQKQIKTKKP